MEENRQLIFSQLFANLHLIHNFAVLYEKAINKRTTIVFVIKYHIKNVWYNW
jgi:hypothetical protein